MAGSIIRSCGSPHWSIIGVFIAAGSMMLTRAGQPRSRASVCITSASLCSAALEELYAPAPAPTVRALIETMQTMSPVPAPVRCRWRTKARLRYIGPCTLTAKTWCQRSSSTSTRSSPRSVPALLTRQSKRSPYAVDARVTPSSTAARSVTSRATASALPRPASSTRPTVVFAPSASMSATRTCAPDPASSRLVARPSPLPAPVTSATRPSSAPSEAIGPPSGAAVAGLLGVGLLDGLHQLVLLHPGPPADVELLRHLHQVRLRGVGIHSAGGLAAALAGRPTRLLGLLVGGPLVVLGLPVVADLLERVLEGAERRAVGALALAVLVDGRVVGLDPGSLSLLRGSLQRRGKLLLSGHLVTSSIRVPSRR